jgi:signal transduction histidine kinase
MKNAVESHDAATPGDVLVQASGGGAEPWEIRIVDNGRGIPEHALPKVFDPLFSTKVSGGGLGLTIALGLVEAHGGSIRFERTNGLGTTVAIDLPPRTSNGGAVGTSP